MFEGILKKRKNPIIQFVGWALLGLVCIIFIFIGFSPNSNFLAQGGGAAHVNGHMISLRDYKRLSDQLDQGGGKEPSENQGQKALDILIGRTLIAQEAEKLGVYVSDLKVAEDLSKIKAFYENGVFSRLRYKSYLQQTRQSEREFEEELRRDLVIQKMSWLVGFISKDFSMVEDFEDQVDRAQINIGYVTINPALLPSEAPPKKNFLRKYIQEHKAQVSDFFQKNKSKYDIKAQVRAHHIFIRAKDSSPQGMEQAQKKAQRVAQRTTVENFAKMARKYSDDESSKSKGGDLGFFSPGERGVEFEKAAFGAKEGEIVGPVQTSRGYHLIWVEAKQEAREAQLEKVELQIALKLYNRSHYGKKMSKLKALVEEKDLAGIQKWVRTHQLVWKQTGFFNMTRDDIPTIGLNRAFLKAALKTHIGGTPQILEEKTNSYLIRLTGSRFQSKKQALNKQLDYLKEFMKKRRSQGVIQSWVQSLRKKASVKINPNLYQ